ncbi:hypothetical protein ACVWXO_002069 [Bradyrhizobium sp. LM2.7]
MRPAAAPRKAFAATATLATVHLRLCAGDEGGQAIDVAGFGDDRLRLIQRERLRLGLRLILRLRTVVALAVLARLLVLALIGLIVAGLIVAGLMITLLMVTLAVAHESRLLRLGNEARLLAEIREILTVVIAVVAAAAQGLVAARLLALPELLLGGGDQAEIMLRVLVVILGSDRIAGRARVACELKVLLRQCAKRCRGS